MVCPQFSIGDKVILTFDDGSIIGGTIINTGGDQFIGADRYVIEYDDPGQGIQDTYVWDDEFFNTDNWGYMEVQIAKTKVQSNV